MSSRLVGRLKAVWPECFGSTEWPYNWFAGEVFWCIRFCKTSPVVLAGVLRPSLAEHRPKTEPEISGQTVFRFLG
jgi:hypothetical protein